MANEVALVLEGILNSDGTIQLDRPPGVSPGRVRITLRPLSSSEPQDMCIPDDPWLDDAVSAPFDLPLPATPGRIRARQSHELLPDRLTG